MRKFTGLRILPALLILSALAMQGCALSTAHKRHSGPRTQDSEPDMTTRTTEAILKGTPQP